MIVNPRLFNYRLIIGTLVIAIVILGSYSFSSYSTLRDHQSFLEQETKLVQNELSEMIIQHDDVSVDNNELTLQLKESRLKVSNVLDSIKTIKTNSPVINTYQAQVVALKKEKTKVVSKMKSISHDNVVLKKENKSLEEKLDKQEVDVKTLVETNHDLEEKILNIEALAVSQINAKAIETSNPRYILDTKFAKNADHVEICFTILENQFAPKGRKEIYVQILNPENKIIAKKGFFEFGDDKFPYSGKTNVNYMNENVNVCTKINVNARKPLVSGTYKIAVFHKDKQLGNTEIILN